MPVDKRKVIEWLELECQMVLVAALLICGATSAFVTFAIMTPAPPGSFRLDYYDEINGMAKVLNIGLPVSLSVLVLWLGIQVGGKRLITFSVAMTLIVFLCVYSSALAVFGGLAAMHAQVVNLWHDEIWWR